MDNDRARYVESLEAELAHLNARRESPDILRRRSEVKGLLDSYAEKPAQRRLETPERVTRVKK